MRLLTVFELLLIFLLLAFAAWGRVIDNGQGIIKKDVRKSVIKNNGAKQETTTANRYCKCNTSKCNCCRDFILPVVSLNGPGCASLQYLKDDRIALSMSFGNRVLTNTTVSGRRPKPICMPLPGSVSKFCGRLYSVGRQGDDFGACLSLELQSLDDIEAALRVSCFKFGPRGLQLEPAKPLPDPAGSDDEDDDDDDDDDFDLDDDDDDDDDDEDDDDDDDFDADDTDNDIDSADYTGFSVFGEDILGAFFDDSPSKPSKKKVSVTPAPVTPGLVRRPTRKPGVQPIRPTSTRVTRRPTTSKRKPTRTSSPKPPKSPESAIIEKNTTQPQSISTPNKPSPMEVSTAESEYFKLSIKSSTPASTSKRPEDMTTEGVENNEIFQTTYNIVSNEPDQKHTPATSTAETTSQKFVTFIPDLELRGPLKPEALEASTTHPSSEEAIQILTSQLLNNPQTAPNVAPMKNTTMILESTKDNSNIEEPIMDKSVGSLPNRNQIFASNKSKGKPEKVVQEKTTTEKPNDQENAVESTSVDVKVEDFSTIVPVTEADRNNDEEEDEDDEDILDMIDHDDDSSEENDDKVNDDDDDEFDDDSENDEHEQDDENSREIPPVKKEELVEESRIFRFKWPWE